MRTDFDWCDGAYVPDGECYCLCEVEGMRFTKYIVSKWDGEHWWIWLYVNKNTQGWFGLDPKWKIKKWCLIEEDDEDNN